MALPIDQQPSQVGTYEKILTIANRIMNGGEITKEEAIELIDQMAELLQGKKEELLQMKKELE